VSEADRLGTSQTGSDGRHWRYPPSGLALGAGKKPLEKDALFDVAIQIAEANSLAAVVFPSHNGAHLLSNHPSIEKDIEKRFTGKSEGLTRRRSGDTVQDNKDKWRTEPRSLLGTFFAYEQGYEKVSKLYAIWPGNLDENTLGELEFRPGDRAFCGLPLGNSSIRRYGCPLFGIVSAIDLRVAVGR
jgi:hypothetical protein